MSSPAKTASATCDKQEAPQENAAISPVNPQHVLNSVLQLLGRPADLAPISACRTRATPITPYSFRVNIFRMCPDATLTDSFFVKVNARGLILQSTPPIAKKYLISD